MNALEARLNRSLSRLGSTRQLGLMRIALAWILWASWGDAFVFHFDVHPERIVLAVAFYLLSILVLVGWWTRPALAILAVVLGTSLYMFGEPDYHTIWTRQHRQLSAVLVGLLGLTPCDRSFSLRRWVSLRRAELQERTAPSERGALWGIAAIRGFAGVVFAMTTLWQLGGDWLSGVYVRRAYFGGKDSAMSELWGDPGYAETIAAWLLVAHASVCVGLWLPWTRRHAVLLGMALYLCTYTVTRTDTNALIVVWMLFAFLDSESIHAVIDRLHGRGAPAKSSRDTPQ